MELGAIPGAGYHASGAAGLASKVLLEQVPAPPKSPIGQSATACRPPLPSALQYERTRGYVVSADGGREQAQEAAQLGRQELEQAAASYNKAAAAKAKRQALLNEQTRDAGVVRARTISLCCLCDATDAFQSAPLGKPVAPLALKPEIQFMFRP